MKLSEVERRIPLWYKARISVDLRSSPGVGKSETLEAAPGIIAKATGIDMGSVTVQGPLLTPQDAIGYLIPKINGELAESLYTEPNWFKTDAKKRLAEYEGGVVIVEEADKADIDVKKILGEAALSSRVGPHRLPPGWVVWMAGNRAEDRSGSTKELDHLINRQMRIDITPDVGSWTNWAITRGVLPLTVAWANTNPQIVFECRVPEKQGPWCTPRSLVRADRYMQVVGEGTDTVPDDPVTLEEVTGMIGGAAAASLFAHVRLDREMPHFDEIVRAPEKVKVPTKADAQMLVCYNLAHRVELDTADAVIKYVERLPKEFTVTFMTASVKRNARLIEASGFNNWVSQNASLLAAIGGMKH